MGELFRRLRYLVHRRRLEAELANDMEFHREMAARAGRRNFGNTLRLREQSREAWGWTWLDRFVLDLQYGARILARSPGFTVMAVLVLALGIGVNIAAFSLFNMVALRPLPVRDPDSLILLERRSPDSYNSEMSYPSFQFYRDHARSLAAAIAVFGVPPVQLNNDADLVKISFVTPNYFEQLGTPAALGRVLSTTLDASPSSPPVMLLSYPLWQQRFNSDPSVIGRTVRLNRKPVTIAGVLPYDFASLASQHPDVWVPIAQQPYFIDGSKVLTDFNSSTVRMWARLAPGITAKAAEQELRALTDQLRLQHPEAVWKNEALQSSPGGHAQVLHPEEWRVVVMVAVLTLLILAVSCANLGALLLARGVTRQHEIGIRLAIGANRARIFRQLCTESLLLAALGAVVGLALAWAVMRFVLAQIDAPRWITAAPDGRLLLFTVAVMFLAVIFFGFAPAWQIARSRQHKTIARQLLVTAQIAASCVLLIVSGLLVRAAQHALYTDPGFGYESTLSIDPQLAQHGFSESAASAYLQAMRARLSAIPGVRAVGLVHLPPMGHTVWRQDILIDGRRILVYPNQADADYFRTMEIPLLAGRTLQPGEQHAIVISATLARLQGHGQNPLGKLMPGSQDVVVGIVGDAHVNALNDDDAVEEYWAPQPADMPGMVLVVRTGGPAASIMPAARAISQSLAPAIFPEMRPLKGLYQDSVRHVEQLAAIVSLIGLVAVLMAGVGIIGLVAFTVSQRTRETAIRLALGSRAVPLCLALLRQFVWPVALGATLGATLAAVGSRFLRMILFGVSNLDPLAFAAAIAFLFAVVALAAVLPLRRALRLNVARALHQE
ncbi:ABC transporter permease [Acidobacteria bacterium AB60]|nr:ABC transporter permease [Acidobacteria bacterium AB60]